MARKKMYTFDNLFHEFFFYCESTLFAQIMRHFEELLDGRVDLSKRACCHLSSIAHNNIRLCGLYRFGYI